MILEHYYLQCLQTFKKYLEIKCKDLSQHSANSNTRLIEIIDILLKQDKNESDLTKVQHELESISNIKSNNNIHDANFLLGLIHRFEHSTFNIMKAIYHFREGAQQKHIFCLQILINPHIYSIPCEIDYQTIFKFVNEVSNHVPNEPDVPDALTAYNFLVLGELYHRGIGVAVDFEMASACFEKSFQYYPEETQYGHFWLLLNKIDKLNKDIENIEQENTNKDNTNKENADQKKIIEQKIEIEIKKLNEIFEKLIQENYPPALHAMAEMFASGYLQPQDFQQAFEFYQRSDKFNLVNSKYKMAIFYMNGMGVNRNEKKAFELFQQCVMQKHRESIFSLIKYYCNNQMIPKALELIVVYQDYLLLETNIDSYLQLKHLLVSVNLALQIKFIKRRCQLKDGDAAYDLGNRFEYGLGLNINIQSALKCYSDAAKWGCVAAENHLAIRYAFGENGFPLNKDLAIQYMRSAASKEFPPSLYNLGYWYVNGIVVDQDIQNGIGYLKRAMHNKETSASLFLGKLYMEGSVVEKDLKQSIEYLNEARYGGSDEAAWLLAKFCQEHNTPKNLKIREGILYNLSNFCRDPNVTSEASYELALAYRNGVGVERDPEMATSYLLQSANQGNSNAQFELVLYYGNQGDAEKVFKFLKLSAKQYHKDALNLLASFFKTGHPNLNFNANLSVAYSLRAMVKSKPLLSERYQFALELLESNDYLDLYRSMLMFLHCIENNYEVATSQDNLNLVYNKFRSFFNDNPIDTMPVFEEAPNTTKGLIEFLSNRIDSFKAQKENFNNHSFKINPEESKLLNEANFKSQNDSMNKTSALINKTIDNAIDDAYFILASCYHYGIGTNQQVILAESYYKMLNNSKLKISMLSELYLTFKDHFKIADIIEYLENNLNSKDEDLKLSSSIFLMKIYFYNPGNISYNFRKAFVLSKIIVDMDIKNRAEEIARIRNFYYIILSDIDKIDKELNKVSAELKANGLPALPVRVNALITDYVFDRSETLEQEDMVERLNQISTEWQSAEITSLPSDVNYIISQYAYNKEVQKWNALAKEIIWRNPKNSMSSQDV